MRTINKFKIAATVFGCLAIGNLFAANGHIAQDANDAPSDDISITDPSTAVGFHSTYAITNGVGDIKIVAHAPTATGMYWNVSGTGDKYIGEISSSIDVRSDGSSGNAIGIQVSSANTFIESFTGNIIVNRGGTKSGVAYGIYGNSNNKAVTSFSGNIYVKNENGGAQGMYYGSATGNVSGNIIVEGNSSTYTDVVAINIPNGAGTISFTGDAFISAKNNGTGYGVSIRNNFNNIEIQGTADSTQTFVGRMRASRLILLENGNFIFDSHESAYYFNCSTVTIGQNSNLTFKKSLVFDYTTAINLAGKIFLEAVSVNDYVNISTTYQYGQALSIGENSVLTVMLGDLFIAQENDIMDLLVLADATTVNGSFSEVLVKKVNGGYLDSSLYEIITGENGSVSVKFLGNVVPVPEPATCAAIAGVLALAFAAYRRRK